MAAITLDGGTMAYESAGPGDAPAVLFLHGLSADRRDWQANVPAVAGRRRAVAVDLRGHGRSSRAARYSVPMFADDVGRLIDELDLAPVHVVAASMGGMIAQQLALDGPGRVRSLTLVNTVAGTRFRSAREAIGARARFWLLRTLPMKLIGRKCSELLYPHDHQQPLREQMVARWLENRRRDVMRVTYGLKDWSVEDRLGAIACPVLVIRGERDRLFRREDMRLVAERVPRGRYVEVADSGHCTPIDQPGRFNELLLDFLDEVEAGER